MGLGLLAVGIAVAVAAAALLVALIAARKDADENFPDRPIGGDTASCAASSPRCVSSPAEAQELFDELRNQPQIPFDYPVDCCYTRAHEMCRLLEAKGIECRKYWLFEEGWGVSPKSELHPVDKSGNPVEFWNSDVTPPRPTPVQWVYHVAPLVDVRQPDGRVEEMVLDPSLSDRPMTKEEWRRIQGDPPGAYGEESDSAAYFQNQKFGIREEDRDYSKTAAQLEAHRNSRDTALREQQQHEQRLP